MLWDGTTLTRPNYSVNREPTGNDWDTAMEEIRAMQRFLLYSSNPFGVSIDTVLVNRPQIVLIDASGGEVQITLPPPLDQVGIIRIVKVDSSGFNVVIVPNDSELINGDSELRLTSQWSAPSLITDLTNWIIV